MRVFFAFNILLWAVLFVAWLGYVGLMGLSDPVSVRVGLILAITAALLSVQGVIRWRRHRRVRVSA